MTAASLAPTKVSVLDSETISARTTVDLAACSHQGKVRQNNEDSFLIASFGRSLKTLLTNLPELQESIPHQEVGYLMLVADGMGGAAAGEVASRTAVRALIDLSLQTPDWILKLDDKGTKEVLQRFKKRFERLGESLAESIKSEPGLSGMGTTMTMVATLGTDVIIAHVGDSRAYLFSNGHLVRLTKDQTMAQLLSDLGVIPPEQADVHHSRHLLTGAITANEAPAVELNHLRIADGDQLLLCSDGLTGMVSDAEIASVLEGQKPATETCQSLLDLALENGGHDNVTLIVAKYQIPAD